MYTMHLGIHSYEYTCIHTSYYFDLGQNVFSMYEIQKWGLKAKRSNVKR